jgi:hypothetical protein
MKTLKFLKVFENFIILNFFEILWNFWALKFYENLEFKKKIEILRNLWNFEEKNWTLNFFFNFFYNFEIFKNFWNFITLNFCAIKNHIALSCHVILFIDFAQECNIINILPLIEGVMVDYHTQKTNIIRDEVEGDIVVFWVC